VQRPGGQSEAVLCIQEASVAGAVCTWRRGVGGEGEKAGCVTALFYKGRSEQMGGGVSLVSQAG
jgi:hypothetical protein